MALPCEFAQSMTSSGSVPDIQYARMTVTDGAGMDHGYLPVADMTACGDGFYLVPGAGGMPGRVHLCPTTCATVQMDSHATVNFAFECPPL